MDVYGAAVCFNTIEAAKQGLPKPETWKDLTKPVYKGQIVMHLSALEWCAIVLALSLVWAAEGLNTALERLTDLVSPGFHPLAGKAKDLAAGAVLLASVGGFLTGLIVFLSHLV